VLPLAFNLTGKRVLVLGAGRVAGSKIALLDAAGADITVITTEVLEPVPDSATLLLRPYQPGDLAGFQLVISATGVGSVNDQVVEEAKARGIWLNVVDDPSRCDFYFTAVHRDGPVIVSVSTEGSAPALAQYVRDLVRSALPKNLGGVARRLRSERDSMHDEGISTESISWRARIDELVAEETTTD